jgi:hypothetical protein
MKETKGPSEKGKEQGKNEDKSKYSPFFNSIKGFVSKLNPDLKVKDKESDKTDNSPKTVASSDDSTSVSSTISKENTNSNTDIPHKNNNVQQKDISTPSSESKKEDSPEKSAELPLMKFFHQAEIKLSELIKSDRKQILRMAGLVLAAIFIILGLVILFGSADKVLDNVVSGERAVTSVFFIIMGLLIIAGIMAPNIIRKTSFDSLFKEVQTVEEDSSSKNQKGTSTKKEPDSENNTGNEVNKDKD